MTKIETSFLNAQYHKKKTALKAGIIALIVIVVLVVIGAVAGVGIKILLVRKAIKEDKMEYYLLYLYYLIATWMK